MHGQAIDLDTNTDLICKRQSMRNKKCRCHNTVAAALKQASVIKTLAMAASGFKNGTIRVIPPSSVEP
jgi:hypothetical protein